MTEIAAAVARSAPPDQACPPDEVWKSLARLLATPGRSRMRLWSTDTQKFTDTAKRTDRFPTRPAAVYLYTRRRTQLIWLDFDAKHHGRAAVDADLAAASAWIIQCGGVILTDHSTSGGRHLICPLAIGTSASHDEMVHLVRLLAARLPTLDITPITNAETGCMTPPGSPCREGGFRQLDGSLDTAVEALTTRSAPDLLPRLYMLLGALKGIPRHTADSPVGTASTASTANTVIEAYTDGRGDEMQIVAPYLRTDPLPPDVADYAIHGIFSSRRPTWQSNHEARMSVVTQAIARGHSLTSLRTMIDTGGPWHDGLGRAYERYHHRADQALSRDFTKALNWLVTNVLKSSPPRHKPKYSPGGREGPRGPQEIRDWLANAMAWADREFAGKRYRWTVHAVLQTIAFYAVVAGEQISGTWLVGVGGRTLSLGSGLLSEDTVWRVLADLRDRAGAPLILARHHVGTEADVYALTTQNRVTTDSARAERVRVEPVHPAWMVLGHHKRRIYELVAHHRLSARADIFAAAAVPRATGDAVILDLEIAGLIARSGRGSVTLGPVTLDMVAYRHHLDEAWADRLERHRVERRAWRKWLAEREQQHTGVIGAEAPRQACIARGGRTEFDDDDDHAQWLEAVMATGPPDDADRGEFEAIQLLADLLGARIIAA